MCSCRAHLRIHNKLWNTIREAEKCSEYDGDLSWDSIFSTLFGHVITPSQQAALHESSNVHVCVWRDQLVAINVPQHMNWLPIKKIILWDAVDSLALDDSASSFLTSWKHLRHSTAPTRAADTISHSEEAIIPPTARAAVGGGSSPLATRCQTDDTFAMDHAHSPRHVCQVSS